MGVGAVTQRLEPDGVPVVAGAPGRQRGLAEVRELVDAGDRGTPVGDIGIAARPGLLDLPGQKVPGLPETAACLDLLKVRPGLCGEGFGQIFDVPGAAGRVEDPADMGLLQKK